mmetsp:Transcript_1156/g.2738  ORF Transcript_1156/g.2738 Transcript_1156/m.2738 type:complete len:249 (-) Transcript_1156:141-887(-)
MGTPATDAGVAPCRPGPHPGVASLLAPHFLSSLDMVMYSASITGPSCWADGDRLPCLGRKISAKGLARLASSSASSCARMAALFCTEFNTAAATGIASHQTSKTMFISRQKMGEEITATMAMSSVVFPYQVVANWSSCFCQVGHLRCTYSAEFRSFLRTFQVWSTSRHVSSTLLPAFSAFELKLYSESKRTHVRAADSWAWVYRSFSLLCAPWAATRAFCFISSLPDPFVVELWPLLNAATTPLCRCC